MPRPVDCRDQRREILDPRVQQAQLVATDVAARQRQGEVDAHGTAGASRSSALSAA